MRCIYNCKQLMVYTIKIKDESQLNKAIISNSCVFLKCVKKGNLDSF